MPKRIDAFQPALPEELLMQYNFFELYPFDGGGRFIQQEIVASIDDRMIAEKIISGTSDEISDLIGYSLSNWKETLKQH